MASRPIDTRRLARYESLPPEPPYQVGDFAYKTQRKHDLILCPLCWIRDGVAHWFEPGERRDRHFWIWHDPDDVGRPLAELLEHGAAD